MTTFSIFFLMIYAMEFFNFYYNVYNILIFKIMYNLSWRPNNVNVFLHFKNQCNMRSFCCHNRKCMLNMLTTLMTTLKTFLFIYDFILFEVLHIFFVFIKNILSFYTINSFISWREICQAKNEI